MFRAPGSRNLSARSDKNERENKVKTLSDLFGKFNPRLLGWLFEPPGA